MKLLTRKLPPKDEDGVVRLVAEEGQELPKNLLANISSIPSSCHFATAKSLACLLCYIGTA